MADRVRQIITFGLLAAWLMAVPGYNLWYRLTLGAWQDRIRAQGYLVNGSSGYMPDGSGVHRGGQFFPSMFVLSLLVLMFIVVPLICLVWWKPGSGRIPDARPGWTESSR